MKPSIRKIALAALILLPTLSFAAEHSGDAAEKPHKIVFQVVMDGPEKWEGAFRNVENVIKELGAETTEIEVVAHSKGLGMLLAKTYAEHPEMKEKLDELHANGVVFVACENTMKRKGVEKKDLVEIATTVPSGVAEVVLKQEAGYSYIKAGD
ncbi:MAG: DsrE family protein [Luteolibacter sp.]